MNINNAPKLYVALLVVVCCTVLLALGKINETAGMTTIGSVIGYILGNGVAAKNGDPVEPILSSSKEVPR
jgi:hypothetical protein